MSKTKEKKEKTDDDDDGDDKCDDVPVCYDDGLKCQPK